MRLLLSAMTVLIVGAAVLMLAASLGAGRDQVLPACPLASGETRAEVVCASYEAIRSSLQQGSLGGVPEAAERIAQAFAKDEPRITATARRLELASDVESARRALLRLHRLLQRYAGKTRKEGAPAP